jgi:DNA polymerase delta subunit 3
VQDAGLLCAPTEIVRIADGKAGSEIAPVVGKIIGANIQVMLFSVGFLSNLTSHAA